MGLGLNGKPLTKRAVHSTCNVVLLLHMCRYLQSKSGFWLGLLGQQGHGCRLRVLQITAEPLAECQQGVCKGSARVLQGFVPKTVLQVLPMTCTKLIGALQNILQFCLQNFAPW